MGLRGPLSSLSCLQTAISALFKRPGWKRTQFNIGYLLFAFFAIVIVQQWWQQAQTVEVVPYSELAPRGGQDLRGGGSEIALPGS